MLWRNEESHLARYSMIVTCVAVSLAASHQQARAGDAVTTDQLVAAQCRQQSLALKLDWETKAKPIREAGQNRPSPPAFCRLVSDFEQAELKMVDFMATNSGKCHIPTDVVDKARAAHATTLGLKERACGST